MSVQSEQALENQLIAGLQKLSYELVLIKDEKDLRANLKTQLEKHNKAALLRTGEDKLSEQEFKKVLNILSKGSVFEKAKTLREVKQYIVRDNGENLYFEFINQEKWCENQFQVTRQVAMEGKYKNRYEKIDKNSEKIKIFEE